MYLSPRRALITLAVAILTAFRRPFGSSRFSVTALGEAASWLT
jgi:hypothetical protein